MPVTTRSAFLANQQLTLVYKTEADDQIKQEPQTPVQTTKKRKFEDGDAPEQQRLKNVVVAGMDKFERLVKRAQKLKEEKAKIENETNKKGKEVDGSEAKSAAEVEREARKAQSKFAKAKNEAQKRGDWALANIYFELEKKAGNLPRELKPKKTAAKKTSKTPVTQPRPRKSRKTILKKSPPTLLLPIPKKEESIRKKLKKAIAAIDDQDTKYTTELAEALASVPQEKKADFWRLFGEKVEIETKVSDLKQKTSYLELQLDTVKSKLDHMTKQE